MGRILKSEPFTLYNIKNGEDGKVIRIADSYTNYSTVHTSGTQPADSTFTLKAVPDDLSAGAYLWSKTTVVYSDSTSTSSYAVSRTGIDGQKGTSVTIKCTTVNYAVSNSATQPDNSAFTNTSIPALSLGCYLWTKTAVNYSDGNSTVTYSVSRIGTDGSNGTDGTNGSDGQTYYTHFAYSNSADGSSNFNTTYFSNALYIGVCSDTNSADPTSYGSYTWSRLKGDTGATGATGAVGPQGATGASSYTHIKYADVKPCANKASVKRYNNAIDQSLEYLSTLLPYEEILSPFGEGITTNSSGLQNKSYAALIHVSIKCSAEVNCTFATFADNYGCIYVNGTCLANNLGWVADPNTQKVTATFSEGWNDLFFTVRDGDIGGLGSLASHFADPTKVISIQAYGHFEFMTDTPDKYIGVCIDSNSAAPTDPSAYEWNKMQGPQGNQGIQGPQGPIGDTGASGYQIVIVPAQLVFDTDNNGIVTAASLAANTAKVMINRGGTDVTPASVSIDTTTNTHCTASVSGNTVTVKSVETDSDTKMSCGFGYVGITATLDGKTLTTKLPWAVNLHKVTASLKTNDDNITASVTSITKTVNNMQIGGRNRAQGTSNSWSPAVALSDVCNDCVCNWNVLMDGLQAGDTLCVSFDLKYDALIKTGTGTAAFWIQAVGNDNNWNYGMSCPSMLSRFDFTNKSGQFHYVAYITLSADNVARNYYQFMFRSDYITGNIYLKSLRVVKSTKDVDWAPAPEDTDSAISTLKKSVGEVKTTADSVNMTVTTQLSADNILSGWTDGYLWEGYKSAANGNFAVASGGVLASPPFVDSLGQYVLSMSAWGAAAANVTIEIRNYAGVIGSNVSRDNTQWGSMTRSDGCAVFSQKLSTLSKLSDGRFWKAFAENAAKGNPYQYRLFIVNGDTNDLGLGPIKVEPGTTPTAAPTAATSDDAIYGKIRRTGINIEDGSIEAQADNFKIKNNAGEQTFAINENGDIEGKKGACFHGDFKSDGSAQFGACRIEGTGDNTHFGFVDDDGQEFKSIEVTRNATLPLSEMNQSSKDSGTVSMTQGTLFASSTNGNNDNQEKDITYGTFTTKYDNDELTITGALSAEADTTVIKSTKLMGCSASAYIEVDVKDANGNYVCSPINVSKQSRNEDGSGINSSNLTRKVTLAKAGTYTIVGRLIVYAAATGQSKATARVTSNLAASWKYNPQEIRTIFGNDGWYNRTSNSQWVHLKGGILSLPPSCLQIVGDTTMKGTGMLLAGSVQGGGQINSYIGVAKNDIRRISQGIYIIYHTIGNVKYAALATWAGNDQRGYINVFEKTATSFKVSIRVYGNSDDNVDHDFDFAVFGEMQ